MWATDLRNDNIYTSSAVDVKLQVSFNVADRSRYV